MNLPYTILLKRYPDGVYFAEVKELPGCMTEADTKEEVLLMIDDAMRGWLEIAIHDGRDIPEPVDENFSGRILLRTPKSLHKALLDKAKNEGVSLNQYLVYQLSKSVQCNE
ncbi:MAG: type II toxin-antitoxin system HicB family antitoxin [Firmicutes bacterium]|nr:type II toxin-antitoxin system HicB family antitoxin [Bacillota bacterium]